jgi:GTPase SAR1 family protein
MTDWSFTFSRLNEFFHDFDWSSFFSRYTKTEKFNHKIWIRIEDELFRMFNASFNWRMTISFWTSFIALRIATKLWVIVDDETFNSVMREYASNTSNVNIKSSKIIESFNVLKCYVLVSSTSTSHLVIALSLSDQASLLDNLS